MFFVPANKGFMGVTGRDRKVTESEREREREYNHKCYKYKKVCAIK